MIAITTSSSIRVKFRRIIPGMLREIAEFSCCICLSFLMLYIFSPLFTGRFLFQGRYRQQLKGDVYLSGPMPSDVKSHAIMQSLIRLATFPCHSRQQTGCALNCGWLRRAFFKACPPVACTIARPDLPARLGTPVDLRSTPIRGRG